MMRFKFSGSLADFKGFLSTIEAALTDAASVDFTAVVSSDQQADLVNAKLRGACLPYLDPRNKIKAIKTVRTVTGWGLEYAKYFVEREFPKEFNNH